MGTDELLNRSMQDLTQGIEAHAGFSLRNGMLFYEHRLVVLCSSSFIPMIIIEFHSSHTGGHSSHTGGHSGEIKT